MKFFISILFVCITTLQLACSQKCKTQYSITRQNISVKQGDLKDKELYSQFLSIFDSDKALKEVEIDKCGNVVLIYLQLEEVYFYNKRAGDSEFYVLLYNKFHAIYSKLFSFDAVQSISIYLEDENNQRENYTYFPSKSDYEIKPPNSVMQKKWYIPNIDYFEIFPEEELDSLTTERVDQLIKNLKGSKK
ncbi:hypothetical protein [uncultured Aquimarina sp.]|uniref:hypothetical protein n=1 Tax=uncultured Aquimarina sp. TaxID=575652 RepID=UPI00260A39EE|nr:hypothetical protein [uncultured Aquimarina sp.]